MRRQLFMCWSCVWTFAGCTLGPVLIEEDSLDAEETGEFTEDTSPDTDTDGSKDSEDTDDTDGPLILQTLVIFPSVDAMIRSFGSSGDGLNYGDYLYNNIQAWTNSSNEVLQRSLLAFDLSEIPSDGMILDAQLNLYSDASSTTYPGGHDTTSGSNACVIEQVITAWEEMAVTWNTQPETNPDVFIEIPGTTGSFDDRIIDVTDWAQSSMANPEENFGLRIRLNSEDPYRRMVFASTDHSNVALHPRLVIAYSE
jgi:hypothetical protein